MNVLDTSVLIEVSKGTLIGRSVLEKTKGRQDVATTIVSHYEFLVGAKNEREENFIDSYPILLMDIPASKESSRLFHQCKKDGISLASADLWIAGICKAKGATLHTLDSDFKKIPGLKVQHY